MKRRAISGTILLLFTVASTTHAQTQFTGWVASFNTVKLNKKFSIHFDGQFRSSDQLQHMQTLLLRPGLNYHIKKNIIATAGYGYIHNRRIVSGVSGYAPEHRIFEQLIVNHKLAYTTLSHRFRLEQRFIGKSIPRGNDLHNQGNTYANRFRYFFRTLLPIAIAGEFRKGPFFALQNEVFMNIGDKSAVNGEFFDQNRAYGALGYRFSTRFDAEVGYLNQYINGRNNDFTNNHIVQLAVYTRL
jgi:hypothetical protein